MDGYLFGSSALADQAFRLSVSLLDEIMQLVVKDVDMGSGVDLPALGVILDTSPARRNTLDVVYDAPTGAGGAGAKKGFRVELVNEVDGERVDGEVAFRSGECECARPSG
jgi:hypothetical protein